MNILLVDDDTSIAAALRLALSKLYSCDTASSGTAALQTAIGNVYGAIVLDLNLPDIPGLEVCRRLRASGFTGAIIILSAEVRVISKITLLDAGADDYMTKPFSLGELKARLRTIQRRNVTASNINMANVVIDDLVLDSEHHRVMRSGQMIKLRRKEFALLECLMQNAGSIVTRDILSHHAWRTDEEPWANTIDVHIKFLRDKIDRPFTKPLITTVHGLGYKLEVNRGVAKIL